MPSRNIGVTMIFDESLRTEESEVSDNYFKDNQLLIIFINKRFTPVI